jgi:RnfABCDGE-type electron transport complex B subunit
MSNVLFAVLVLGGLGLLLGALLAVASKVFHVDVDERVLAVEDCLSGANCGACGYAGCAAYAAAVVSSGAPVNKCAPGGKEAAEKIAAIMGVEHDGDSERFVAFVRCSGGDKALIKYNYNGIRDCAMAAASISGGPRSCSAGCIGYGSCVAACPFDAIHIVDGVAKVDHDKCCGCMRCAEACPKKLIVKIPFHAVGTIACNNTDKGGITRKVCESGCLGCKLCEKNCPNNAVHVENNISVKDFSKCQKCGICAEKCPRKLIFFPTDIA